MKSRMAMMGSFLVALMVLLMCAAGSAWWQETRQKSYFVPDSSVEHVGENGVRAHTNHVVFMRSDTTTLPRRGGCPRTLCGPFTSCR